ncbi:MAG: alpha/beta fold hydrolase [Acidobacteria bacterium]|nr:alpha/beta fold hydrolase [Acidobacteriota bacterium]
MTTRMGRRSWLRIAIGVYCALLLLSTAVRFTRDQYPTVPEEPPTIEVPALDSETTRVPFTIIDKPTMEIPTPDGRDTLNIAWKETDSSDSEALPLVLLHGSPGSADNFSRLTAPAIFPEWLSELLRSSSSGQTAQPSGREPGSRQAVEDRQAGDDSGNRNGDREEVRAIVRYSIRRDLNRRTIAPDLPGFGASDHRVADYSSRGHADSTLKLLDRLEVERFHVLGFSMGGAVALHLADQAPDRVASIILMSSIGVQELELLGDYRVNHGLHGLQLGLFWGLRNLVPHFGALDMAVARSYARNFYDTDQRPLRGILESLEAPVFIIHGAQDPLVPAAAAREHHRIVPHSDLWMRPDSHFFLFRGGEHLAARIEDFLSRVEAGEAPTRADAEPKRLRRAALPFDDLDLPPFAGPALLIVFLLLVFAAYASEDLTCITAGLLVAQGRLDFPVAVAACYAGILSSDLGIAWLARVLGRPALRLPPFKWWVSEARFEEASAWLRRRALVVVLVSRFLPGTRLPTCLAAGILRTSLLRFCFYFALAVAIWTPAFVGVNALLGREAVERFGGRLPGGLLGAALALALVIFTVRSVVVPLFTWRGRRLWRGRLLRIRHWEFWPMWAFYPPLALYILWQGVRRGSLTAFTAINPAMPLGGLLGESKSDILDGLHGIGDALPAWRRLPPGSPEGRVAALRDFLEDRNLDYPVVLKPDTGERGRGVAVARSEADVAAFFEETPGPALAQEYVAGEEYGVFWARHPGRREGHVFSITHKVRPTVTGDGTSTLERLILDDARAVAIAHIYRREHPGAATYVPAAGEGVELTEVGAHSRGTIFLDANDLHTPELEQAMNAICTAYDGFDFGRLDGRVPSAEALRRGEGLRVLEVNGVTSEATHMYDRGYGFFAAHAILRRQWRMAFDLADDRIRAGVQPATVSEIVRAVRTERRARRGAA